MNDKDFGEFLNDVVPLNLNIQKYLITTRSKLKEHRRIAISHSSGSDSDTMADIVELVKPP